LPLNALEEKNVRVVQEHFETMMKIYPKFENGMFLLDAQGTLWADYPAYPDMRGRNFAFREYFKTTMEKQRGIIGVPYRSARTGEAVLTFTALLRGSKNQVLGMIGCSVQLLHPNALGGLRTTKIGESGYVYVYDTSRLMILHPEDQRVLDRDVPEGSNVLFDAGIDGFEGVGETITSRGVPMLLSLKRVPGTNWIIGAQKSKSEAFAPIRKARKGILWAAFCVVFVAILVGAFSIRRMTEPLAKLRRLAIQLGQDAATMQKDSTMKGMDIQQELKKIQPSDEIGDLASAFKEMAKALGQTFTSLRGALRDWERTFDSVHDPIFLLDKDNRILRINRSAERLLNMSIEEAQGQVCYKLIHGTESPPVFCPHHQTIATGKPARAEVEEPFLGGFFEITATPLFGEDDQVIGTVHVMRDITERKKIEKALLESEEKYRSVIANAMDAIFIAQDGFVKFPNPSTLALTGYSEEEYARTSFVNLVHPEDRRMVADRHERRLRGEEVLNNYAFRVLNKAGEELWVQLNAVSIDWDGRPAILCFLRDITSQKRLEAQFQQAQKMEAVGTLAGGIAHDFNNLLQTVLGYTDILLHEEAGKSISQELQHIKHAAQRGAELTRQILTFSRKVQSKLRPVDLNIQVRQVQKLLQRTIPKMIDVELRLADDLRVINADAAQVEQILMNLAVNSRDAMPEGGKLTIKTQNIILDEECSTRHFNGKHGEYVLLTVSDTGVGMNQEVVGHIYDPFYTTKEVGKGTGLGLAMVYGIVKSHDGYILCESEPGQGTHFKIYLPVVKEGRAPEELQEHQAIRGGSETILLVDDEEPIRSLGEQILTRYGYAVLKAHDGETALKLYEEKKEKIALVLLDLIMPGMGGKKCLEGLLQINQDARVVIASGYSPDGSHKSFLEGGAKNFIGKPFNMKEMLQVVREVLDEN
jgi:PAS domain S-box-containing protein